MMHVIKIFFALLFSFIAAFGIWYLVFLFLTGDFNPMNWHWITKAFYLMIVFSSFGGIIDEMTKNGL
jgi:multisubunit Na+/H+ antiporter MnhG subunit